MDHKTAALGMLTERFIMGDLTTAQRDEFLEHVAVCFTCGEDLKVARELAANARALFKAREPEAKNLSNLFVGMLAGCFIGRYVHKHWGS